MNKPVSIRTFLGMDQTGTRDIRRSSSMLNCVLNDEGTPEMRCGYEKAFPTDLGAGKILGIHKFLKSDGTYEYLVHHGTKLYKCVTLGVDPTLLYTGLSSTRHSTSFQLATKLSIIDGTNFVVYNGTTVVTAESIAYTPIRYMGRTPSGGGTVIEDFNLLQPKWTEYISTVAGTTVHQLSEGSLDSIASVKLAGVTLTNPTNYTVVLATGVLTLVTNPGTGTNNLEVTPSKTRSGYADHIKKCTTAHVYGGPSDSKVFVTGNPDYPHMDWWTGLPMSGAYDPTYWPDTNYDRIGGDNDPVIGYEVLFDKMVVFKQNSIYQRGYELTTDAYGRTVMRFPATILNAGEGCIEANSIVLVENRPFFLSDTGVYAVEGGTVRDQNNVRKMSTLVDIVPNISFGHAVDHGDKYYLALDGDIVWVCDYHRAVKDEATGEAVPVWYKWDDMPVSYWLSCDLGLLFGSALSGMVYRMKEKDDVLPYNDDGAAISPCYWNGIFTTFDRDDMTKLIQMLTITQKPASHATLVVNYSTEEGDFDAEETQALDFMDYNTVDYSRWSYISTQYEQAFTVRVDNARGIQRFQVRLSSTGEVNDYMGFSSIDIIYQYLSGVR